MGGFAHGQPFQREGSACRETLGDLKGIVRKKTRVPQRTTEPASEKIVRDVALASATAKRKQNVGSN